MENLSLKKFKDQKKKSVLISIAIYLLGFVIIGLAVYSDTADKDGKKSFHELIYNEEGTEKYGYVDVSYEPYLFAEKDDETGKLYFVFDEQYMYIAKLDATTVRDIKAAVKEGKTYQIVGRTTAITSDIKEIALDTYNEESEKENQISATDFDDYFGTYYLNTMGYSLKFTILLIIGVLAAFLGFMFFLIYLIGFLKAKRYIKKMNSEDIEKLEKELNDKDAFHYKKAHLVTMANYILDYAHGLDVIKYEDIVWVYRYEIRNRGVRTNLSIMCYTKDKKRHQICNIDGVTKKQASVVQEVLETIIKKNNKTYVGFDKETRKKVKEEYQIR